MTSVAAARPSTASQAAKRAESLRKLADGMQAAIDNASRPMTQNATPKRLREYHGRLIDAANLERGQRALRALAQAWERDDVPEVLRGLRSKSEVVQLMRHRIGSNGYYDVHDTGEYADKSAAGVALQRLVAESQTPEECTHQGEAKRRREIERMEHALHGLQIDGFFPTPPEVIDRMLRLADIAAGHTVLEPSAGKGDIVQALYDTYDESEITVTCVERSPRLVEILKAKEYDVAECDDFLEFRGSFDRIVMNPPFERGQDAEHVRHAYEGLKPGGRLVAVMSTGPFFRTDRKSVAFREWLYATEHSIEGLPAGSFTGPSAFRQTGVAVKLVVVDKPPAATPSSPVPPEPKWSPMSPLPMCVGCQAGRR